MFPPRRSWSTRAVLTGVAFILLSGRCWSAAEVKLDKDFLSGVVEKIPPSQFQKEGRYRGTVQSFRMLAIDPKTRRFLVACQVAGEFRPLIMNPLADKTSRDGQPTEGWRSFRFDVRVGVNVEPARDGTPRFGVDVEEVRRRELEGFAGILAKMLGKSFDSLVKQAAEGKASLLNERLNAQIRKRVKAFQEYGVFRGIDYAADQVVLHFDVSRFRSEGIAGFVFPDAQPGTVPLYRWLHRGRASHFYMTSPGALDPRVYVSEGVACFVFDRPKPQTVPLYCWRGRGDHVYTTEPSGQGFARAGYRPAGIACYVYPGAQPGTVPLYRFVDPRTGQHFFTTHPHAEFLK